MESYGFAAAARRAIGVGVRGCKVTLNPSSAELKGTFGPVDAQAKADIFHLFEWVGLCGSLVVQ